MHNAAFVADGLDFVSLDVDPMNCACDAEGRGRSKAPWFQYHHAAQAGYDLASGRTGRRSWHLSRAVNTVVIDGSSLRGYNTDGGGIVMACGQAGIELSGQRVLLLGAGGAAAIAVAFGPEQSWFPTSECSGVPQDRSPSSFPSR